ncbi:MAG TPA: sugar phosphate isomerase/epimerase family protein [Chthonomonadaceae bacterium]|nr:sugar phosphate isomerase/epimerase family protein [Chthonomonadaceae bacterium]
MARPVTLFTGQWADLTFDTAAQKAKAFGYDGIELPCWGDHFDPIAASGPEAAAYCQSRHDILANHGLKTWAISNHLAGQAVLDNIDARHKQILPPHVWGDGDPAGVNARAAEEMKKTAIAAKNLGVGVVNGFTGSSIWHLLYSFPPVVPGQIEAGYALLKERWTPILDVFQENGIKFALEVHPTEIAFDIVSARRALEALDNHPAFGFNYDPSHLGYQGVDYVKFIYEFSDRIFHVHMKDVYWSPAPKRVGVFGGHVNFGDPERFWDFRSLGHGSINFEEIIRALNAINFQGPLSVEWEDSGMDREHGAAEAAAFVKRADFKPSAIAFDSNFDK